MDNIWTMMVSWVSRFLSSLDTLLAPNLLNVRRHSKTCCVKPWARGHSNGSYVQSTVFQSWVPDDSEQNQ